MIKGIVFDCDGVIVDSEPYFARGIADQLAVYGIPFDEEIFEKATGGTASLMCEMLLNKYPEINQSLEDFTKDFYVYTDRYLMSDELEPMPGLAEFVKENHEKDIKLIVASSSPRYYVEHKLKLFKIMEYFDDIVCGDDISHTKPHPEIYLKAIEKMGYKAEEIIAIEDSTNGIKSAQSAGLYCVGFKYSEIVQDTHEADEEVKYFKDIKILK
ncbi:MAG: HAD family phosphatase [Erysipelotrichaceae bacterium]|nr:HAD family phosphatase [Erysipelotrichaceae bacterium]